MPDLSGLRYALSTELHRITESRDSALDVLFALPSPPTEADINLFANCARCRHVNAIRIHVTGPICSYCKAEDLVIQYQQKLFSFVQKKISESVEEDEEDEFSAKIPVYVFCVVIVTKV